PSANALRAMKAATTTIMMAMMYVFFMAEDLF
ncbi:MAG: hypothetical protein ACI974_001804, partial [Paraglaciecola sp.]